MSAEDLIPYTTETGRAAGLKSAAHRKQKRLRLDDVEAAFGPLLTLDDAMRRLDRLGVWLAAGLLSGGQGGAAVRSVETWVKAHESKLSAVIVGELRERLEALEVAVKRANVRGVA